MSSVTAMIDVRTAIGLAALALGGPALTQLFAGW
jgi:hypothetical protein